MTKTISYIKEFELKGDRILVFIGGVHCINSMLSRDKDLSDLIYIVKESNILFAKDLGWWPLTEDVINKSALATISSGAESVRRLLKGIKVGAIENSEYSQSKEVFESGLVKSNPITLSKDKTIWFEMMLTALSGIGKKVYDGDHKALSVLSRCKEDMVKLWYKTGKVLSEDDIIDELESLPISFRFAVEEILKHLEGKIL